MKKRVKGKPTQWLDRDLKYDMDRHDKVLPKARKTKSNNEYIYRKLRNYCNNKLRKARKNHYRNMLNESKLSPQKFWRTIKSIFPTKSRNATNQNKCTAKSFGDYFATAVSKLKKSAFIGFF